MGPQEVKSLENKKVAILVLAVSAAVLIATSGAYAMGRQTAVTGNSYPGTTYGYGMGQSMMGGSSAFSGGMMGGFSGHAGGMMGGYGMMGSWNGTNPMYAHMEQIHDFMQHCRNSTTVP